MSAQKPDSPKHNIDKVVDAGVALKEVSGTRAAAEFMAKLGVPDAVIARVLCEPAWRRRASSRD
ncbi:MAG TPA: hypothetical protein VFS95_10725 [Telluria sp.]|jgi:hypothetical protein|nr:hypothetical protein [Telluria sp.]